MNFRIDYLSKERIRRKGAKKVSILGKIVAITGTLPGMNRSQAQWWVTTKKKAAYSSIVDKRVTYLIVGSARNSKPSSKVKAAEKLGIQQIAFNDIE